MTLLTIRSNLSTQNMAFISLLNKQTSRVWFTSLNILFVFYTQLCQGMLIHTGQFWSYTTLIPKSKAKIKYFYAFKNSCSHRCNKETCYIREPVISTFSACVIIIIYLKQYTRNNIISQIHFLYNHKYRLYNMAGILNDVFVFLSHIKMFFP
jgi:hypothetical protein